MTEAERHLWQILKAYRLGVKFSRQHIINEYIVDFVCLTKGVIIEVDGEYHNTIEKSLLDKERTIALESAGFKILRFKNEEVFHHLHDVIERIQLFLLQTPTESI